MRMLALVLGVLVLTYVAYRAVYGRQVAGREEAAQESLSNVRKTAGAIELEQERRTKEALETSRGE
jgi:hypothetical protein